MRAILLGFLLGTGCFGVTLVDPGRPVPRLHGEWLELEPIIPAPAVVLERECAGEYRCC